MSDSSTPLSTNRHITVVIPTCDRPEDLQRCFESLATVSYTSWDIVVLDQSHDDRTQQIMASLPACLPSVTYQHMPATGAARARNAALRMIDSEIIAFLDDDCTVQATWLQDVVDVFDRHPAAAVAFGEVKGAPHDSSRDFIPVVAVEHERVLHGRLSILRTSVVSSSCMYLQPARLHHIVPRLLSVDEYTGAGAHFGCEDIDFFYRLLAANYIVVVTPHIAILHHGARPFATGAGQRLIWRYLFSTGAMHMKFVRSGDPTAMLLIAATYWKYLSNVKLFNLLRRRPTHLRHVIAYTCGLYGSFQLDVNPQRYLYAPKTSSPMIQRFGRKVKADRAV